MKKLHPLVIAGLGLMLGGLWGSYLAKELVVTVPIGWTVFTIGMFLK